MKVFAWLACMPSKDNNEQGHHHQCQAWFLFGLVLELLKKCIVEILAAQASNTGSSFDSEDTCGHGVEGRGFASQVNDEDCLLTYGHCIDAV